MRYFFFLLTIVFLGCQAKEQLPTSSEILAKSIGIHDPNGNWEKASFSIYIQEPRVGNAKRFSEVKMNNRENSFELKRNRDEHISTHIVQKDGRLLTYLNDQVETDSLLVKKYRLQPERNTGYQRFYNVLLGLPMSLQSDGVIVSKDVVETTFNKEESYKLNVIFNKPLFSKHWNVFIAKKSDKIIGLEMVFPDDPTKGERLVFEGEFQISDDIKIPRIRHWRELDDTYAGSDIILKSL
ncbi:DUF6503 family protein [Tenacibaculum sp. 190524A05c]|uniref:DUF6503 family protein n=1 Tax=Tenacibaculum platacis TaxID=3137852 RepID=UPI0032B1E686